MVLYNPKDWFSLIFQFHKSDTFRKMFLMMIIFALYTWGVVYIELHYEEWFQFKSTIQIHSLLGFVLGLLLVFRTNTAYDRWWEGRRHWGSLVNNTRNLAMKLNTVLNTKEERNYWSKMISNYVFSVKEHLREGVKFEELDLSVSKNKSSIENAKHVPNVIASEMYEELHQLYSRNTISGDQLIIFDKEIKSFTDIVGGCERIKKYTYSLFI